MHLQTKKPQQNIMNQYKAPSALLIALLFSLTLGLTFSPASQAEMLISPLRLMLDSDNNTATLTIRNTGDGTRSYRLGWLEQRMDENGSYHPITESEQAEWPLASKFLRFSPRQISVGPGENQTVRVSYRPPANMAQGEYISHLKMQILPGSAPSGTFELDSGTEGIAMQLEMLMSFSIPIVVRHKTQLPKVNIGHVEVLPADANNPMRLAITIEREGNSSSFGQLKVEMQRDENSPVELIGNSENISVFTEISQRRVVLALRDTRIPSGAWIRISYEGQQEYRGHVFAEKIFRNQ